MKGVGEGERPERVIRESERERGDERMLAAIGRRQPRVGLANPATQLRCGPTKMAHNDARVVAHGAANIRRMILQQTETTPDS